MTVTGHTLVADIAATVPSSVRVFQRYGVDFCCGGQTPLGAACDARGPSFVEVAEAIEKSVEDPDTTDRDWAAVPLSHLTAHRALYAGLGELEMAMHVHGHLENNILLPRATALALSREQVAGGRS